MAEQYRGMAIGIFELDSECACFVALDAGAGACVKMRGSISDVKAAMEVAIRTAEPIAKVVSHTVIASPSEETETAIAMTITK